MKEEAAQPVLAVRFRSPVEELPSQLGRIYGSIISYIQSSGGTTPLIPYVAYFNLEMQDLDLEAGFTVTETVTGEGEINAGEIPAGKQVTCTHKGPYAASEAAYNEMTEWGCRRISAYQPVLLANFTLIRRMKFRKAIY